MDNDDVVVEYGGMACSPTQLAMLFREGVLLTVDMDIQLCDRLVWPTKLSEWAKDEYHLVAYCSMSRRFLLVSEAGHLLKTIPEGDAVKFQGVQHCVSNCGNLSSVTCSDSHLIAVSHIYGECYRLTLSADLVPQWECVHIEGLSEPVVAAADDTGFAILGKGEHERWIVARALETVPIEGLPAGLDPEGFAIAEDTFFILYDKGFFDYRVACFRRTGTEYRLQSEERLEG